MGECLLLLYVIYQTIIATSVNGVTLPFSDRIGKVSPVKPKPLSSPLSQLCSSRVLPDKSPLAWDDEDIMPNLFSPVGGSVSLDFLSPLAVTSSSKPLPVLKIKSLDVKVSEDFDKKLIPPKVKSSLITPKSCNTPSERISAKEISLPSQNPFVLTPQNLPNNFPFYPLSNLATNKILSLPSIQSLPTFPLESLKSSGIDLSCSDSKINNGFTSPTTPNSTPITFSSTLSLTTASSLLQDVTSDSHLPKKGSTFGANTLSSHSSSPRGRTPADMLPLNDGPISNTGVRKLNVPNISTTENEFHPPFIYPPLNFNSVSSFPIQLPAYSPLKKSEFRSPYLKPLETPKIPLKVPSVLKPGSSSPNIQVTESLEPFETTSSMNLIAFESKRVAPKPVTPSCDIRDTKSLAPSISSKLNSTIDQKPNCSSYDSTSTKVPPKMRPFIRPPLPPTMFSGNALNSAVAQASISSPNFGVHSCNFNVDNFEVKKDFSKKIEIPNKLPLVGTFVETDDGIHTDDLIKKSQARIDLNNAPRSKEINIPETTTSPAISSCQITQPKISSDTSIFSPTNCPSTIFETSVPPSSYINLTPPASFSQSASNMVSSINDMVSNIAQNILFSYTSYIKSAPQNLPVRPTSQCKPLSNPYIYSGLEPEQLSPVQIPLPTENLFNNIPTLPIQSSTVDYFDSGLEPEQLSPVPIPLLTENLFNNIPTLPIQSSTIDCFDSPPIDFPIILTLDAPKTTESSLLESPSNQLIPVLSSQPLATSVVPFTSFVSFSSPQLCPSYLPLPALPSYPIISSPIFIEPQIIKVSSPNKDSEDVNTLIELMLLAKLLNGDNGFNWDDLDPLLALLSISIR